MNVFMWRWDPEFRDFALHSPLPEVGASRPRMRRASVDFPQPDSPTIPSTLPDGTLSVTSSTATTRFCGPNNPDRAANSRRRFLTSIAFMPAAARQ